MPITTTPRTTNWAVEAASRMKGADFPIAREEAKERLKGIKVGGRSIEELLDEVSFPVATPAEMLKAIKNQISTTTPDREEWSIDVARALEGASYPISREEARERLRGIVVRGVELSKLVDRLRFPCMPAQLIDQIEDQVE